jgi:MoaA/NifB/PqqE/SkfB family radical SAM enzyme
MIYCPLAYKGLAINTTGWASHCCTQNKEIQITDWKEISDLNEWYRSHAWFTDVRNNLENDTQHSACKSCWHYENKNAESKRQRQIKYIDLDNPDTNVDLEFVDLRLSNKCNLQCKMCYGGASDQLAKLAVELDEKGIKNDLLKTNVKPITDTEHILNLVLDLPSLKTIRFAGGEPFVMPEVEEFLFKLVEKGKTDLKIEFITNCTSVKTKIINVLEKFKIVDLSCSIDGTGDALEYQRYPAKWKTVEKNFIKLCNSKCNTALTPCITHLNLLNMADFLSWASQFPSLVAYNEVYDPSFLNFRYVPLEERTQLINDLKKIKLTRNFAPNWKNFINNFVHEYKEPTEHDCNMLKHYSEDIWNYKCNVEYLTQYPYMKYMIEKSNGKVV